MKVASRLPAKRQSRLGIAWPAILICVAVLFLGVAKADNPIIQAIYTADPAVTVNLVDLTTGISGRWRDFHYGALCRWLFVASTASLSSTWKGRTRGLVKYRYPIWQ